MADEKDRALSAEAEEEATLAAEAAANSTPDAEDMTFMTSTGVLVRALPLMDNMIQRIYAQLPEPDPPVVETTQGSKTIRVVNDSDPTYKRQLMQWTMQVSEALMKLSLLKGMEILELPPDIVPYEDDDEWEDELSAFGLKPPEGKAARYLEWVRYRILPQQADTDKLQERATMLAGISKEELEAEISRFRRILGGDADPKVD